MKKLCKDCGLQPAYKLQRRCLPCWNAVRRSRYKRDNSKILQDARDYRTQRRQETILAYGGVCECCGESNLKLLSIDHVGGGGNEHRREVVGLTRNFYTWLKKNNYPKEGFRALCYNCNMGAAFNGGICPHKESNGKTQ